ncbi:hypothetical protein B0H19DRAFT_1245608 [Mycena capillaripes]|nr:hypothetical protein B0H19DRAFT_1245608 [Mycena capillaripes]
MSRGVVLIAGINRFLGTYTALAFLDAGYTVKGTGRTAAKAANWIAHFPVYKSSYQSVVVTDFGAPGAFDNAVKGCDIIVHVASPNNDPKNLDNEADMLIPAINGTRNLLVSTKLDSHIRRVVFTSTFAQARPGIHREGLDEEAKASTNPIFVYCVSNALAERAFWEYIATEKPAWAGTVILPCRHFPALRDNLPPRKDISKPSTFGFDTLKTQADLGITFMPFEKIVVATIGGCVELEEKFKA